MQVMSLSADANLPLPLVQVALLDTRGVLLANLDELQHAMAHGPKVVEVVEGSGLADFSAAKEVLSVCSYRLLREPKQQPQAQSQQVCMSVCLAGWVGG